MWALIIWVHLGYEQHGDGLTSATSVSVSVTRGISSKNACEKLAKLVGSPRYRHSGEYIDIEAKCLKESPKD